MNFSLCLLLSVDGLLHVYFPQKKNHRVSFSVQKDTGKMHKMVENFILNIFCGVLK